MSKATDKPEVRKGLTKVSNAIAKAIGSASQSGNVITQCVSAAKQVFRGTDATKDELAAIANDVARLRKWSEKSAGPRKSEVRKIVRNYLKIDDAVKRYKSKSDTFTWHECMKLLTQLNKDQTVPQAVAACLTANTPVKQTAIKQVQSALGRIANVETRSAKIIAFRKDLSALIQKHGIA